LHSSLFFCEVLQNRSQAVLPIGGPGHILS
jgi:hypothetical protein